MGTAGSLVGGKTYCRFCIRINESTICADARLVGLDQIREGTDWSAGAYPLVYVRYVSEFRAG